MLYSKIRRQKQLPTENRDYSFWLTLGLPAMAVLINALLVYRFTTTGLTVAEHLIQMIACCTIVPLIYMHFSWQFDRKVINVTVLVLWLLCLPILATNIILSNPFEAYEPLHFTTKPFALYVVSHGEKLWGIYTGDLIIILQALVTTLRIVPLAHRLRDNGLRFSRPIYAFFVWWIYDATFVMAVSSLDLVQLSSVAGTWCYYLGIAVGLVSINVLFALHFDIHPVETEQGEVVDNVDVYLENLYADLAQRMEEAITKDQLFRQPGYSVEDICERLQTNRKLLAQMMLRQYGIHFPEYLNKCRLEYAQQLLLTARMKMEQVAEESGFASGSHMNRVFNQQLGCNPSQWAKEHRQ